MTSTTQCSSLLPYLSSRDDYTMDHVCFTRPTASSPLGLGLEHVGMGTPSSSILVDEYLKGSVVEAAGGIQCGSVVVGVNGRRFLGERGIATERSFELLKEGIGASRDVRIEVVRPRSIACILTMVCAFRRRELLRHIPPALRRRLRRRRRQQQQ